MKAIADNLTKPRWFRAVTRLGRAARRIGCAGSARPTARESQHHAASGNAPKLSIGSDLFIRLELAYFWIVGTGLFCTAILKIAQIAMGDDKLGFSDPLLPFLLKSHMSLIAALVEIIVVICLASHNTTNFKYAILWTLGIGFVMYHVAMQINGYDSSCGCVGVPGSWTFVNKVAAANTSKFLLALIILGPMFHFAKVAMNIISLQKFWTYLVLIFFVFMAPVRGGASLVFHLNVKDDLFSETGETHASTTYRASFHIQENNWRSVVEFQNGNREEVRGDGKATLWILHDTALPPSKLEIERIRGLGLNYESVAVGTIVPEQYPYLGSVLHRFLWFAFVGGSQLSDEEVKRLPSLLIDASSNPKAFICGTEIVRHSESDIVSRMVYLVDPQRKRNPFTNELLKTESLSSTERNLRLGKFYLYPDRMEQGEYRLIDRTNIMNRTFPLSFELIAREPTSNTVRAIKDSQVTAIEVFTARRIQGRVVSIDRYAPDWDFSSLERKISLVDHRFANKKIGMDFIHYNTQDAKIPASDDPLVLALAQTKADSYRWIITKRRMQMCLLWVAAAAGICFPIYLFRRKTANHQEKER